MKQDVIILELIKRELERQTVGLELIASENYVSDNVLTALGSVLTNKYAEGYPGARYYGGCEVVDQVEQIAIERLCKLFDAEYANVQPHSGAQANMAVFMACLKPGDTFMGLDLAHGGHLTHGSPVNLSGSYYNFVPYGVNDDGFIDYDEFERKAKECQPKLIVAGASAYPRVIDFKRISEIAKSVGAYFMVDMAHIAGLVAAGIHPSPVPYADVVTTTTHKTLRGPRSGLVLCRKEFEAAINKAVFPGMQGGPLMQVTAAKAICFKEAMSQEFKDYAHQIVKNCKTLADVIMRRGFRLVSGGTDNHLLLVDVAAAGLTGKVAAAALDETGIIVNKNTIPFDKNSPFVTSGIRIGTATAATRGMKEADMEFVGDKICTVLENIDDVELRAKIRAEVAEFTSKFMVP